MNIHSNFLQLDRLLFSIKLNSALRKWDSVSWALSKGGFVGRSGRSSQRYDIKNRKACLLSCLKQFVLKVRDQRKVFLLYVEWKRSMRCLFDLHHYDNVARSIDTHSNPFCARFISEVIKHLNRQRARVSILKSTVANISSF